MIIQEVSNYSPSSVFLNQGFSGEFSCYSKIFQEILQRFKLMTLKHEKVLFIRFDLRFPDGYLTSAENDFNDSDKEISTFFLMLKEHIFSYGIDIQYVWVKDQSYISKQQKYQCMALLSADIPDNSITEAVSLIWSRVIDVSTQDFVLHINRDSFGKSVENGIIIKKPSANAKDEELKNQQFDFDYTFGSCILWASYLGKIDNISQAQENMRRFGFSRISDKDHEEYLKGWP